jgi:ABC-type nitrate/sulfonate/bicarbonate transport system substrate-binding protein
MYIAKEAGYYRKYGLEVNLVFANHPSGIAMLIGGKAEVNLNSLQQAMQITPKDDSIVVLGSPLGKWLFALVGGKNIKNVRDLKGKKLGIAQIGDSTYNYALRLLAKSGLTEKDIELIVVGAESRVPALTSGHIDATMLSAPAYFALENSGYKVLANISDYDDIFTPNVLLMRRQTIEQDPTIPISLIQAHAEAVKRFYEDKSFAVDCFVKYDKQERLGVERVYDAYAKTQALDRVPYIQSVAMQYMIDNATDMQSASRMKEFDYHKVIENGTVDSLAQGGFFELLFGPSIKVQEEAQARSAFR